MAFHDIRLSVKLYSLRLRFSRLFPKPKQTYTQMAIYQTCQEPVGKLFPYLREIGIYKRAIETLKIAQKRLHSSCRQSEIFKKEICTDFLVYNNGIDLRVGLVNFKFCLQTYQPCSFLQAKFALIKRLQAKTLFITAKYSLLNKAGNLDLTVLSHVSCHQPVRTVELPSANLSQNLSCTKLCTTQRDLLLETLSHSFGAPSLCQFGIRTAVRAADFS